MLSKSDTRGSAMSGIAGFMSCSFMKLIYQKFSFISVLSQAEQGIQLKTQLNWDQNCIFTEWNELDVRSAMFGMAEFWVSDFESKSTYLDVREADQTVADHEIDTIQLKAGWIETKSNKILTQWEGFLDTDYDDAEYSRTEPIYNECDNLSSKIRCRVDTFIKKAPRTAQVASGQVVQTPSYNGPPRTNDMLKPKKQ